MNDRQEKLLQKADKKLENAKFLFKNRKFETSVSEAYYSMFHASKAILLLEDSNPKTHAGTASELGKLFRDRMDRDLISSFTDVREYREDADYGLEQDIGKDKAEETLDIAEDFLSEPKDLIEK